jgi:6-phosphogluconolactonase (cycloisomerase 2 family)
VLVTRGNHATATKPEDPGAIKTFAFENGVLRNLASIAPGNGLGFGPRHLDFHPKKPWAFISIERQNKLYVYALDDAATGLARDPLFVKETLSNPKTPASQGAGPIHVDRNGKFVYLTNRTFPATDGGGREISEGGENNVVVYAIDQNSGEPTPIQHIDGHGVQLRTFGIDGSGRLLVVASIMPMPRRDGASLPAGMTVLRIAADGKLNFVRKHDVEVGAFQQFWSGMLALP